LSSIDLFDAAGRRVPGLSAPRPVTGRPETLVVDLSRPLAAGVYTVHWRSVSAIDGHVAESSYAFGVGAAAPAGAAAPTPSTPRALLAWQSAGRWLLYLGLILLVGAGAISLLLTGACPASGARALLVAAAALAAAGLAVTTLAERSIVGVSLGTLLGSSAGRPFVEQAVAVLVCILAVAAGALWPGRWSLAAVGCAAAAAFVVNVHAGHAGGVSPYRPFDIAVVSVHAVAAGVWIGGLAWLLLCLRGRPRPAWAPLVRDFSAVAAVALAVVLATGLLRALAELGSPAGLVRTSFGVALLVKLGFVAALVALGAHNRLRVVPALVGEPGAGARFGHVSRAELVTAAAVLAATAVLTGLAPGASTAAAARPSPQRVVVSASDYATTVTVELTVTPGIVGANRFVAQVDRYGTTTPAPARSVTLEFTLPSHPGIGAALVLRSAGPGAWTGRGLQLSLPGTWKIEAVIQQARTAVVIPLSVQVAPRQPAG
ncbi:MAG TPA: CopD family protein, partial [Thermoleophilia bacterium]|nr:CopD family protein [Thermoleophilia bacterium]